MTNETENWVTLSPPETWKPAEIGETIEGVVVEVGEREFDHKGEKTTESFVKIRSEDRVWHLWCGSYYLKSLLDQHEKYVRVIYNGTSDKRNKYGIAPKIYIVMVRQN